ncbi:MAG: response regulator [Planctomycetota bacterium]
MTKKLLDVGNCGPDHHSLIMMTGRHFDVEITQAHGMTDALESLRNGSFDLVVVNRLMDRDGSSGLEIIKAIKSDDALKGTPVMMVTNYADHQQLAVAAGAEPGYGKSTLFDASTAELLRPFLG